MAKKRQRAKKRAAKQAAQEAAAKAQKATEAKAVSQCPLKSAAEKEKERVEQKYKEIEQHGHAVQRHGEAITPKQLEDRAVRGFDPVTGTKDDAYNKKADGSPAEHLAGRHATKFNSKEAMVKADETIRASEDYKKELEAAQKDGKNTFAVKTAKLEDVFGKDYKREVTGITRQGSAKNPTGSAATDFTDGTIRAVYRKDDKGNWNVHTMFPEPKP